MPKPIFVNGKFAAQRVTGVQRFAQEIITELDALLGEGGSESSWLVLTPGGAPNLGLERIEQRWLPTPSANLHFWEQFVLPRAARGGFLVNLTGSAPVAHGHQSIHIPDAAVFDHPEAYSRAYGRWYRTLFRLLAVRARLVLTLSNFARERIEANLRLRSPVLISPCAADHVNNRQPDPQVLERLQLDGAPYLLAVGSANPTKNFARLALAFARLSPDHGVRLVIVGGTNSAVFASEPGLATGDSVIRTGPVSDAELKALYEHALAFVFPSIYEGFGLPPLEAMACGCPVAAARAASIPEVCGEAALYFDPYDVDSIRAALERLLADAGLRQRLRTAGLARAATFSWRHSAQQVLSAVEEVSAARPASG